MNLLQICTIQKNGTADAGQTGGQRDTGQTVGVEKSAVADCRHPIVNGVRTAAAGGPFHQSQAIF